MSQPNPNGIRYGQVREQLHAELERAKDALVTAAPDRVPVLQGKAQALADVIQWFERGAIAELQLTADHSTPQRTEGY